MGAGLPSWGVKQAVFASSVPMSRLEPDAFIKYDVMDEKLKVRVLLPLARRGADTAAPPACRSSASASTSRSHWLRRSADAAPACCKRSLHSGTDTGRSGAQIVYGHLDDPETSGLERGVTYLKLRPGARASLS